MADETKDIQMILLQITEIESDLLSGDLSTKKVPSIIIALEALSQAKTALARAEANLLYETAKQTDADLSNFERGPAMTCHHSLVHNPFAWEE